MEITQEKPLTLRTERQTLAAILRATRATRTFRRYAKHSQTVDSNAWRVKTYMYVELSETCCAKNCSSPAAKRIAVNIWGTVLEADVCEKHAERHGMWIDDL